MRVGRIFLKKNLTMGTAALLILLILISCAKIKESITEPQENTDNESIFVSFEHPKTKQKFKIVNAYKLYQNYIEEVRSHPKDSRFDIYQEEIIDPIYSACFENGEYLHMVESLLNTAPERLIEIQKISEKIASQDTDKIIKEALIKSSNFIPSKNETTVCVLPSLDNSSSMITVGAGKIIVLYHKYYTDDILRGGVAHEYHHSVWTEKYLDEIKLFTVLHDIIFEGKAVMFEKVVYPEINFTPIDFTYDKSYWSKIAPDLEKQDLNRSLEIIAGGGELPMLYGYSEGYKMVKSYLDLNPNLTPAEWTALSSKEIFEKGKYLEHYK